MATTPDPRLEAIMKQSRKNEPASAGAAGWIQPDKISLQ
jgi:hypothetical protein